MDLCGVRQQDPGGDRPAGVPGLQPATRRRQRLPETRTQERDILVFDDVCTTGYQLNAVAGCLLDQGQATRVRAPVLARAPWR
jgi:hypoxanthine-guanine phosphoribosyltransferase